MSRTSSIISEPPKGVYETPPIPTELLEHIRSKHIDFKRRQAQVIHVLADDNPELPSITESHESGSDSLLASIWKRSSSWHRLYLELWRCSSSCTSDLERVHRLQTKLNELQAPTVIHRPCSCMGKIPSSNCVWAFVISLYSHAYATFFINCLRQKDRDLIAETLSLFVANANLFERARRLCSAAIPESSAQDSASLEPVETLSAIDFITAIFSAEYREGQLPDEILELVLHLVVECRHYRQISLLCWCISMVSVDSQKPNRVLAQLTGKLCLKDDNQLLTYWITWSNWQVFISRAFIAAIQALGELPNPFEIAQENSSVVDETPADSIRSRIFSLLSLALVINYRACVGAVAKGPTGNVFINWISQWIKIQKANYKWDRSSYWIVHALLYQLAYKLNSDLISLSEFFYARFPALPNLLALCTIVEDFVYFSPIAFEDEAKAEAESHLMYAKLKREIRLDKEFRTGDLGIEMSAGKTELLGTQASDLSGSQDGALSRHSMTLLSSVLSELEGFDFRSVQRMLGLHIDPGTGLAIDLRLCQLMLHLLTRVRDEVLPKLGPKNNNPQQFLSFNQLREEVRFFEHTCHFLDNIHIRNEKSTLSSILAKRLYDSARGFKGFNVSDKKQWDAYVQSQIEGQLLKEQRRSAIKKKPPALFSFRVMANSRLGRSEWGEFHLESENFSSHTHTIGDYRPETSLGTDADQVRNSVLGRRTVTLRSVLSNEKQPTDSNQNMAASRKDRIHPQSDCLCRFLILYKGREVIEMQSMMQIKALYIVTSADLFLIHSPLRKNEGESGTTKTSSQDQAWSLRRYHQSSYPYLCIVEFKDGIYSEYLFKVGAERTAFAIMCSDFRNDIAVYQQINIVKSIPKASEPTQCEICSRSFSLFAKKSTCKLCQITVCKLCSEKINAMEFDLSYSKPIRLCRHCMRLRAQENQKSWPKRLWFERAVSAAYTSKVAHTLGVCISSLETFATNLRFLARPMESQTKYSEKSITNNSSSRIRSIASTPIAFSKNSSANSYGSKSSQETSAQVTLRRVASLRLEDDSKSHQKTPAKSSSQSQELSISNSILQETEDVSSGACKPLRFKTRRIIDKTASGKRSTQSAGSSWTLAQLNEAFEDSKT